MNKEKWQLKKSKRVYSSEWMRVRQDDVIRADGSDGVYSVVELKGGVGVVAVNNKKEIRLVGQYRFATDTYSWEIPKGSLDKFENPEKPLDAAKRELEEETGLFAKKWEELTMVHTLMGYSNDKVYLFLATDLKQNKPHPDEVEDITIKFVTIQAFKNMVKKKEITDATSIAAVLLAETFRPFRQVGERGFY